MEDKIYKMSFPTGGLERDEFKDLVWEFRKLHAGTIEITVRGTIYLVSRKKFPKDIVRKASGIYKKIYERP